MKTGKNEHTITAEDIERTKSTKAMGKRRTQENEKYKEEEIKPHFSPDPQYAKFNDAGKIVPDFSKHDQTFKDLYNKQMDFQKEVENIKELPIDSTEHFKYHVIAMAEEMGELIATDKRWKTHRNENFDKSEKLKELADGFITLLNISLYSDFTAEEVSNAIDQKIKQNFLRWNKKKYPEAFESKDNSDQ